MTSCEWSVRRSCSWRRWALLGVLLVLLGGSLVSWAAFDQEVVSWVIRCNMAPRASFWAGAISLLGKGWLQIWLLLVWFAVSHRRREVLAGILALILVGVGVGPLKVAVGRVRPYTVARAQEPGRSEHDRGQHVSFPSGDTAATFAVAEAVASPLGWPLRVMLLSCGAAVGGLRVAALAHYPSDVLVGAAIGLLAGWLAIRAIDRWANASRAVPYEPWLVWGGILGLPISMGVSEGSDNLLFFLETYGVLVLAVFFATRLGDLWSKTGSRVILPFLARTRHVVISAAIVGVIMGNVVAGIKPRELLPLDEPASPWAVWGFLLVTTGALVRFRSRNLPDGEAGLSGRHMTARRYGLCIAPLLVVCGLLMQLQGWWNWMIVAPLFAMLYGAAMIQREPSPSCVRGPGCLPGVGDMRRAWGALAMIGLPLMLELVVEDFICETLLQM